MCSSSAWVRYYFFSFLYYISYTKWIYSHTIYQFNGTQYIQLILMKWRFGGNLKQGQLNNHKSISWIINSRNCLFSLGCISKYFWWIIFYSAAAERHIKPNMNCSKRPQMIAAAIFYTFLNGPTIWCICSCEWNFLTEQERFTQSFSHFTVWNCNFRIVTSCYRHFPWNNYDWSSMHRDWLWMEHGY